jgi:hypothetical protein
MMINYILAYKNLSLEEQISEAVNTAYQIGTLDKLQIQYSFIEGPDIFSDSDLIILLIF